MMKTATAFALIAAAAAAVPAAAQADEAIPGRDYRASYDQTRGVYCLRLLGALVPAEPRPGSAGIECRKPEDWAKRGLFFHRREAAGDQIAHAD